VHEVQRTVHGEDTPEADAQPEEKPPMKVFLASTPCAFTAAAMVSSTACFSASLMRMCRLKFISSTAMPLATAVSAMGDSDRVSAASHGKQGKRISRDLCSVGMIRS